MNKSYLLFILFLLTSCGYLQMDDESPRDKAFGRVIAKAARSISNKYKISPSMTGVALNHDTGKFKIFDLGVDRLGPLSRDEARKLIIECVADMVNVIKKDESIQEHLPGDFGHNNIGFTIFFKNFDGSPTIDPALAVAGWSGELKKMRFITSHDDKYHTYKNNYHETYEEALAIINGKN